MLSALFDTPVGALARRLLGSHIIEYPEEDPRFKLSGCSQHWKPSTAVFLIINFSACVVYMAAAIYTPSQPEIERVFNVSSTASSLGLALFVLGYGTGSLLFAPISEIPSIGRNWPYIIPLLIFVVLTVPTALSTTFAGLMVLRFIQGFFGSPILSTGGASLTDIATPSMRPYTLYSWAIFAFAGPSLGNIIAGYGVPVLGWRWSLWEILICTGPALVLHYIAQLFLPETSAENILLRRAQRIRQITGQNNYWAQSEIDADKTKPVDRVWGFLVMPWKINLLDPSVMFTSIYTGLIYAIFNSMFEFFPLVYGDIYGMTSGEVGLVLVVNVVAVISVAVPYFLYMHYGVNLPSQRAITLSPERRLLPALFSSVFIPAGIFIFGWTSRRSIHWIVPTVGVGFTTGGFAIVLQSIFVYIGLAYPRYAASLFAGNGFAKAVVAFGGVLWSHPLYSHLGLTKGMSLLGTLCAVCVSGIFILYCYGGRLRARSRFAA
ncbi:MFS general substrate transporter [Aspergillus bertholletiae]|uniref:MFS general substrate transporter n=1 Tax=Aspergillus bertholletiae TaxID=1226010 RepID=A0A5N7B0E0_9EURO|nr:MFS general substrate transporter [Aspergillus bertholletiae]